MLGVSHFAVQNAANNSRYEIEQTASEAVDRYADAVMADKLAQADAAAQRAEAAAKSAEDILSDVKSIAEQSGDTEEAPEDVALSISDLVMIDTDIIDSARVEVTEDGYVVYIIAKGDTLCKISAGFGVSVDELVAYNHLVNKNLIYTGSSLRIPTRCSFCHRIVHRKYALKVSGRIFLCHLSAFFQSALHIAGCHLVACACTDVLTVAVVLSGMGNKSYKAVSCCSFCILKFCVHIAFFKAVSSHVGTE